MILVTPTTLVPVNLSQIVRGLGEVVTAVVLALVVIATTRAWGFEATFEREIGISLGRGFVQLLVMGSLIGFLFTVPVGATAGILLLMMVGGALIARNRASGFPSAFRVALASICLGTGTVISVMVATGVVAPTVRNLLPIGSMIVANGMKTSSLALDQFVTELETHRDEIEALLSLGVPAGRTVDDRLQHGVQSSLIPVVDSIKSLGWVWIPGLMAGMILSGTNPIYAAEYQFAVMTMIFVASALTSLVCGYLVRGYAFTDADQLRHPL